MFNVVSNVSICSVCLRIAKLCWVFGICMILYVFVLTFLVLILIHTWLWDHLLWRSALSYFGNIRYATRFHAGNSRSIVMSLLNLTDLGHLKSGSTRLKWYSSNSFVFLKLHTNTAELQGVSNGLVAHPVTQMRSYWDPCGIRFTKGMFVCLWWSSSLGWKVETWAFLKGMNLNTSRSKLKTHFQVSESRFGHCRMKIRSQTSDL